MALDKDGREIPDPRPVEWPLDLRAPLTIQQEFARFMRVHEAMRDNEIETIEEADDFDVPDEDDWQSPYELTEMQEERPFVAEQEAPASPAPAEPALSGSGVVQADVKTGSVSATGAAPPGGPEKHPAQ